MGPLVPDIIGNDLNYVVALFIGIAFGWILEQAGFSTSKKLVGLFYGYDFTVLRVFFTAGVTAMGGVITLEHFGLLDVGLIYINPMFVWSALVGGLIMGLGFVVGGFCPGTSVCAAAIGKKDAMLFILGSFFGVWIFAEGYPLFENVYKAEAWGNVRIFETLSVGQGVFAFLLTIMALAVFWVVTIIESRVNGEKPVYVHMGKTSLLVAGVGLVVAVSGFAFPERREFYPEIADDSVIQAQVRTMSVDEFAFRLMDDEKGMLIADFRPQNVQTRNPLPKAYPMTMESLFEKDATRELSQRRRTNVFVAGSEAEERRFAAVASELGIENVVVLEGGYSALDRDILRFDSTVVPKSGRSADVIRFRSQASVELPRIISESAGSGQVKKKSKRVVGGC